MVYSGKNNWASKFDNASKTMTLPISTWAEAAELSNIIKKPLGIVMIRAIHDMWEFKKDVERINTEKLLNLGLQKSQTSYK